MQHFSAQVLLAQHDIEAEVGRVLQAFEALGFQTGPVVGHSFSIEGNVTLFTSVFGVHLKALRDGAVAIDGAPEGTPNGELPRSALPPSLMSLVTHVLFTEPPTFGPGGGFSNPVH